MAKTHKLVIAFHDKDDMLDFAARYMPEGTAVYHADAMDAEMSGRAPANTYVLRNRDQKPEEFLAKYARIGSGKR